jgi:hypothetical protein
VAGLKKEASDKGYGLIAALADKDLSTSQIASLKR